MKKALLVMTMVLFCSSGTDACVGKILSIGVINSSEGQVLAEMLSTLISERTGTTVNLRFYRNGQDLYEAVKVKEVDILVDNTTRAMHVMNRPPETDARKAYEVAKASYEKERGLVWLKPFGFSNGNGGEPSSYTSTILRVEVFSNFPALPRVLDKLGGAINDETHVRLIKSVEAGEKPKKVARDFLKSRKLI
ncbi:MAG TPA: glycine betaine ABC transporter substrate-binding protein [Thermodesulfovibrionales bacterium]|nr:glycine betaine ABC transporter substrate-binding protein [Thermodesulfovibrionales bacterium]